MAFQEEHDGQVPYGMAINGHYETVYAIKKAIESLGITGNPAKLEEERTALRDFLWNASNIEDPTGGSWSYENGKKVRKIHLYQIKNNETELVSSVETSEHK